MKTFRILQGEGIGKLLQNQRPLYSPIVPTHCTSWKAINQFAKEMPDQFILNTVGTTYIFQ
jgi:hypothetical protein